jgi:hypothetical protein
VDADGAVVIRMDVTQWGAPKSNFALTHVEPYRLVGRNKRYANLIDVGLFLACEIAISGIRGKS